MIKAEDQHRKFKVYHSTKHPSEMNRREKREYKRWLAKNDYWDGYFVIENHRKSSDLRHGTSD